MRAVVLTSPGTPLELLDVPDPVIDPAGGPHQSVLDVLACGICHSDLHVSAGDFPVPMPVTMGHEVVVAHPTLGNCLVYACWGCRQPGCFACDSQQEMICPNSQEIGLFTPGGYADRIWIKDDYYLVPIGDLDPAKAAPLACGGLTAYRAVDHTLPFLAAAPSKGVPHPRALVIGVGGLGQYGLQFLRIRYEAEIVVVDASPQKRELALRLGADSAVAPGEVEGTFTAVVDFVGAEATVQTARDHVARQGISVTVGLFGGTIPFGFGVVPHEAHFMTSVWGSRDQLAELVVLAQQHDLHSEVEVLALEQAQIAHDRLHEGKVNGRFVLVPGATA
jgi:propanol-preferring alcohol dehydrogenase